MTSVIYPPPSSAPAHPPVLLITIGHHPEALHSSLRLVPALQLLTHLFEPHHTPHHLRSIGWTVGLRNQHPCRYLNAALTSPCASSSAVSLVSIPAHTQSLQILLRHYLFSTVIVASIADNPLLSYVSHYHTLRQFNSTTDLDPSAPLWCINPADVQRHAHDLEQLATYLKKLIPANTPFVPMYDVAQIFHYIFAGIGAPPPKAMPTPITPLDQWKLIAEHCCSENLFSLRFAFCRKQTHRSLPVASGEIPDSLNEASASPLVEVRMEDTYTSQKAECVWAILVAIPPTCAQSATKATETSISVLTDEDGLIKRSVDDMLEGDLKIDRYYLGLVQTYASTTTDEDTSFCNDAPVFDTVLNLSVQTDVCQAWEALAKRAIANGATRLLLSDGGVTLQNANWLSRAEKQFQAGSLCVGLRGEADNHSSSMEQRTVALHIWHVCLFGRLFPSSLQNPEDALALLQELWERAGWFALIHTDAEINPKYNNLQQRSILRQPDPAAFRDAPLGEALSVLCQCKYELCTSKKGDVIGHQRGSDDAEFTLLPRLDVIVPTFRVPFQRLKHITSLRASIPCLVTFWIVVDNPDHPNVPLVVSQFHNVTVPHPYTHPHDREHEGVYHTRVLLHPRNLGSSSARNTGLTASVADWALLIDDDVTPSDDLLDAYLSAILRHDFQENGTLPQPSVSHAHSHNGHMQYQKRVDILAGVTQFPTPTLFWHHSLVVSDLPKFYARPVAWPVTANACVRVRHNPRLFGTEFPKSGGGEDIDYGLRVRHTGGRLVVVPDACASHPWFGGSALRALVHIAKWMVGDSRIAEQLTNTHTVMVFPGWAECILLFMSVGFILATLNKIDFVQLATTAPAILITELVFRTLGMAWRATKQVAGAEALVVAGFAAVLQMSQDVVRVVCHVKRGRLDCLLRKLDLHDGEVSMTPMRWRFALKFALICVVVHTIWS